ncbi:protein bric-a-brac 2 isoform X2 [Cimex lectularius]|uniref:Broad n=1 Tax=Cimex lectularius TaxID=79782 RepID=A0A8I6SAQ0_CIMLE|nr:protein bric-a-brac 2 isoform X2 [Cimex lectularius]
MAADHFCLRWNNYQSNMVSELDILRTEEYLVDVTLCCEGHKFRAHKVILSACSPYFRNVFKENPCEHPVVILKDVSPDDVEALLSFVYQGVVYVSEKKLSSFLQTAELLQIKGLAGAASSFNDEQTKQAATPQSPIKRRKGAPVRIVKHEDGEEDSNQMEAEGENVKNEFSEEMDASKNDEDGSMGEESESENGGEVNTSNYGSVDMRGDENMVSDRDRVMGNSRDQMVTLLQQTLARQRTAAPSQSLLENSVQGQFPVPVQNQGSIPELLSPADSRRGEWRCMQPQRCQLCGKVFSNSGNLRQHISNVHMPGERVPCNVCYRMFKNKEYLRKHHVQTHNAPLRRHRR